MDVSGMVDTVARHSRALAISIALVALTGMAGAPAQAATNYQFPDELPAGCQANGFFSDFFSGLFNGFSNGFINNVTCSALTLASGDTITLLKPVSISVTGAFSAAGNNAINSAGAVSSLMLVVGGTLNLGPDSTLNANVSSGGAVAIGARSKVGGAIATSSGTVTVDADGQISGNITTTAGGITLNPRVQVGGAIATGAGVVAIGAGSTIGGSISSTSTATSEGTITLGDDVKVGAISTSAGVVTIGARNVLGAISTVAGAITIGDDSKVGVISSPTGVITLNARVQVAGNINGGAGAVDIGFDTTVTGDLGTGAGVVTVAARGKVNGKIVTAAGGVTLGDDALAGGGISTDAGVVVIGARNTVGAISTVGGISTGAGAITVNAGSSVGAISTPTGVITLTTNVRVAGNINSGAGAVTVGDSSTICGDIVIDGLGVATLTTNVQVGGSVSTTAGAITIGAGSKVGANVIITGAGVVALTSVQVGGKVATVAGAITLTSSRVGGSVAASGAGVVTLTGSVANDATLVIPSACNATPNCIVDNFSSGALDAAKWNALAIAGTHTPIVVDVAGQKRIRMTTSAGYQSTMLQLKKWFPGAGNKITVEFDYYVYGGNGADGITVVFSDAGVAPAPGGFGGSLGYAQRDNVINGFSGGWLAVGIDEYGNFPNPTESRTDYPTGWVAPTNKVARSYQNNISVRGSGIKTTGYALLATTGTLIPPIWNNANTSATKQSFKIVIDHSDNLHAWVSVERIDSAGQLAQVVPKFDAKLASGQAAVPANWLVSFAGSTGAATNIHEIALLSICAQNVTEPGGSTSAGAFDCVETGVNSPWLADARKPLYTKLVNTDFTLDIAALKADGTGTLEANYVAAGGNSKYAKVELFDAGAAGSTPPVSTTPAMCLAYANPVATQTVTFASGAYSGAAGRALSPNLKVAAAYKYLVCRVKECLDSSCSTFSAVAPACSSDRFSVRPVEATLWTTATGQSPSSTATPAFKAGANFRLAASTDAGASYAGVLSLDASKLTAQLASAVTTISSGVVGVLTPGSLTANGVAVDAAYDEVGYLYLAPGAYRDDTFPTPDIASSDCIIGSQSNVLSGGQYGCNIGNQIAVSLGRFIPDHFDTSIIAGVPMPCPAGLVCPAAGFVYAGQSFGVMVTARNLAGGTTKNYSDGFAHTVVLAPWDAPGSSVLQNPPSVPTGSALSNPGVAAASFLLGVASTASPAYAFPFAYPASGAKLAAPTDIYLRAIEAGVGDGVTSARGSASVEGGLKVVSGRFLIANNYGSGLQPLPIKVTAQYWGGKAFVDSTTDSVSGFNLANVVPAHCKGSLLDASGSACKLTLLVAAPSSFVLNNGVSGFKLNPAGAGRVDLTINAPAYLPNTPGRATFGVAKSGPIIYIGEIF